MRGKLFEVSDRIKGTLNATYAGEEASTSNQMLTLRNVAQINAKNEDVARVNIAAVIREELEKSSDIKQAQFMIFDVICTGFKVIPANAPRTRGLPLFKNRHLELWRQLEISVGGDLEVYIEVTGGYSTSQRSDEDMADADFGAVIEVSVCGVLLNSVPKCMIHNGTVFFCPPCNKGFNQ